MKKQIKVSKFEDMEPGDVVVEYSTYWTTVERDVSDKDPHEPGTMLELEGGVKAFKVLPYYTETDSLEEDWRLLFSDGSSGMYSWDHVSQYEIQQPKPVAVAKPQITRDHFIDTINSVVDNNGLEVGKHFATAVIYTADRLGLR